MQVYSKEEIINKLPIDDRNIARLFSASKPFHLQSEDEFDFYYGKAVLEIVVTTGWKIPYENEQLHLLDLKIKDILLSRYSFLNWDEFSHAFTNYSSRIKNISNSVTINAITDVLNLYILQRKRILEDMDFVKGYEKTVKPSDEEIENERRKDIEERYQNFKAGKPGSQSFKLVPHYLIDQLEKDNYCEKEYYKNFIEESKKRLLNFYESKVLEAKLERDKKKEIEYNEKLTGIINDSSINEVVIYSKRIALIYLFMKAMESKIENLYKEEK